MHTNEKLKVRPPICELCEENRSSVYTDDGMRVCLRCKTILEELRREHKDALNFERLVEALHESR